MSFYGSSAMDDDNINHRGRRLNISSFGRLGRRRSASLRRIANEEESETTTVNNATTATGAQSSQVPNANDGSTLNAIQTSTESDMENDASSMISDDESDAFSDNADSLDTEEDPLLESTLRNTMYNAHALTGTTNMSEMTNYEDEDLLDPAADEFQTAPNIVFSRSEKEVETQRALLTNNELPTSQPGRPALVHHGRVFERNRCTVTMTYGDYETCSKTIRRPKRYIVASDGSEGSQYAINWAMGTVLRDGDETLIISVMETDTKLDTPHDDPAKVALNRKIRGDMAVLLCHQAFVLLQRTCLNVKVSCQALHATNARHMLLDLIDFYSPTMLIVGSRGIDKIRGVLGSMSHYLVQKGSVPVMVCHNRLQLPRLPRGKADVVNNVRMRHMRLDQAVVEKYTSKHDEEKEEDGEGQVSETPEQKQERHFRDIERMNRLNRKSLERRGDRGKSAHIVEPGEPLQDKDSQELPTSEFEQLHINDDASNSVHAF
ncbi:Uncharacterized protein MSYG_2521 [Malassezia sympodialis ATCC 42132]|uniref:UspA domain-containing protein n=1 Tax=Malassezia sympodialis (strain ATCC 42132) TaxID=1230383 RepID=A0A1M8A717_MALS4|nr:Uncharacterized protein MSYG_2521 [Malassezia sympodialis ATCC 42132]